MPRLAKSERLKLPHVPIPKRPPQDRSTDFREVTLTYTAEQAVAEASRCLECGKAPCEAACPLNNHIREWLVLTMEGRFLEAARLSRITSPMPEICSRICPQDRLCEGACTVGVKQAPVAIGAVKKFINEYAFAAEGLPAAEVAPATGFCVGIVGAGPAGLACAGELARRGHDVTVYEAGPQAGGLLRYGIPGFKLDKGVVDRRIRVLEGLGIEFAYDTRAGQDITLDQLRREFHALFLGTGATRPKHPKLPGLDLRGVEEALPFLAKNAAGDPDEEGRRRPVPRAGNGTYVVSEDGATSLPGVFAGGDAVRGPDLVGTALRDGRRAAEAIDRYLRPPAAAAPEEGPNGNSVLEGGRE